MDEWLGQQDRSWVSLRLGTLWGVSPNMRRDLVVNAFTWEAIHKKHIHPQSEAKRPILNVDDAGWIISLAAILPAVQGIYNACSENVTVTQLADRIGNATGAEVSPYTGSDGRRRGHIGGGVGCVGGRDCGAGGDEAGGAVGVGASGRTV